MKKDIFKKLAIMTSLLAIVGMTITACGSNKDTVVATIDSENITLGAVQFYAKYQQTNDEVYMAYFGTDMWDQEYSAGITMEEYTKDSIMDDIKEMYILKNHAADYNVTLSEDDENKITAAAQEFMKVNSKKTIKAFGADEASIKKFLELYTIRSRVSDAMVTNVDTNVSDEDAAQRTISYTIVSTKGTATDSSGSTVALTDEEKAAKKQEAQAIIDSANASGDFDTAVTDASLTTSSASYGKDDDGSLSAEVIAEADKLTTEGQIGNVVESDSGYYVIKLVSTHDDDATATRKEEIIKQRKTDAYNTLYQTWEEAVKFTVKKSVWKNVTFDTHFTIVYGDSSTTDSTTSE